MNLGEFLKRNECCPICNYEKLTTYISNRDIIASIENENLKVILDLRNLKGMATDYKVAFLFSLKDSSFSVEFLTKKNEKKFDIFVPIYLIDNFNEFAKHFNK